MYFIFFFPQCLLKDKDSCLCLVCVLHNNLSVCSWQSAARGPISHAEFVTAVEGCIDFVFCTACRLFGGQDRYSCTESS